MNNDLNTKIKIHAEGTGPPKKYTVPLPEDTARCVGCPYPGVGFVCWVLFGRKPGTAMEVYNDFNSDLANMFRCIRDRPMALLKELGFLPLNGRDEFNVLKKFLEKEEFTNEYLKEEIEIAQRDLTAPQFDEIKLILLKNAKMNDVKRAAAFYKLIRLSYGSGCTSYGWSATATANSFVSCTKTLTLKRSAASIILRSAMTTAVNTLRCLSPTTTPASACGICLSRWGYSTSADCTACNNRKTRD